jgi:hypothetical protein
MGPAGTTASPTAMAWPSNRYYHYDDNVHRNKEEHQGLSSSNKVSGKEDSGFRPACVTGFPLRRFQGFSGRVEV